MCLGLVRNSVSLTEKRVSSFDTCLFPHDTKTIRVVVILQDSLGEYEWYIEDGFGWS